MRSAAVLLSLCAACAPPEPEALVPVEPPPAPHIAGHIGALEVDTDGELDRSTDGVYFSAVTTAGVGDVAIMTRLSLSDRSVLDMEDGTDRVFAWGNHEGVSAIGCVGTRPGHWDLSDAPAEYTRLSRDGDLVIVEALLVGQDLPVTTTFTER